MDLLDKTLLALWLILKSSIQWPFKYRQNGMILDEN